MAVVVVVVVVVVGVVVVVVVAVVSRNMEQLLDQAGFLPAIGDRAIVYRTMILVGVCSDVSALTHCLMVISEYTKSIHAE